MLWLSHFLPTDPLQQELLNIFLHALHTGMVLFMLAGWLWRPLLHLHRILLVLIWLSWLGLGAYMGHYGYCILTDYHWQLRRSMGDMDLPPSYIEYLLHRIGLQNLPDRWVSMGTGIGFMAMTLASCIRTRHPKTDSV